MARPMMYYTDYGAGFGQHQQEEWCTSSASARQDSLAYSVSDASDFSSDLSDESFETYCDQFDTKEVIVFFGDCFNPFAEQKTEAMDVLEQKVKSIRINTQEHKTQAENLKPFRRPIQHNSRPPNARVRQPSSFSNNQQKNSHVAFHAPMQAAWTSS